MKLRALTRFEASPRAFIGCRIYSATGRIPQHGLSLREIVEYGGTSCVDLLHEAALLLGDASAARAAYKIAAEKAAARVGAPDGDLDTALGAYGWAMLHAGRAEVSRVGDIGLGIRASNAELAQQAEDYISACERLTAMLVVG